MFRIKYQNLIILFFLTQLTFLPAHSYANATIFLNDSIGKYDNNGKIYFYQDLSRNLTINDIIKKTDFKEINNKISSFGYSNANYWLKMSFEADNLVLKEHCIHLPSSLMTKVHFYLTDKNGKVIISNFTGTEVPYKSKPNKFRNSVFIFKPQPNQKFDIYTLIHNDFGTVNAPLEVFSLEAYERFNEIETHFLQLFQGLMVLAFIITLALFINFYDKIYLFYALYIFAILFQRLTVFGFFYKYFHPNYPDWVPATKVIFLQFAAIGIINFVYLLFTNENTIFPKIKIVFKTQTFIYLTLFVIAFTNLTTFFPKTGRFLIHFMNINFLVSIYFILYILFKSTKKQFKTAKYFAFAITPICIIIVWSILYNNSIIPIPKIIYNYPFEIGLSVEIIFLFAALVSRNKTQLQEQKDNFESQLDFYKNSKILTDEKIENFEKYANSKLTEKQVNEIFNEIDLFVRNNKIFIESNMSISKLSEMTSIPTHTISQCINQSTNKNFIDFINAYRIEMAIECFKNAKYNNFSAEGVGYECGFNTKATFYNSFKKLTGESPAEYRKKNS
ncbi:MAG: helix-turn-helix domain-containing protein [Cytophagales bacterium]|nr:MAG: helix-turn-helix domain-containing protein [Cytophagales bacterium]